jgi:hypothetical protein
MESVVARRIATASFDARTGEYRDSLLRRGGIVEEEGVLQRDVIGMKLQ